jgi:hypothetical protein
MKIMTLLPKRRRVTDLEDIHRSFAERTGMDRRKQDPPLFSRYLLIGRRSYPRRKVDREAPQKVDRYSQKIFVMILFILGLSLTDAFFTLLLVDNGAEEVNPLMAYYLEQGQLFFVLIKYLLTCASVILILFYKDCSLFKTQAKVSVLFYLVPISFLLVIQWQIFLFVSV